MSGNGKKIREEKKENLLPLLLYVYSLFYWSWSGLKYIKVEIIEHFLPV